MSPSTFIYSIPFTMIASIHNTNNHFLLVLYVSPSFVYIFPTLYLHITTFLYICLSITLPSTHTYTLYVPLPHIYITRCYYKSIDISTIQSLFLWQLSTCLYISYYIFPLPTIKQTAIYRYCEPFSTIYCEPFSTIYPWNQNLYK